MADEAGVIGYGGLKIYDAPEGAVLVLGAVSDIALTKSCDATGVIDTWDGDFSIGTATAGNDGTLSGTEADILPSTATPQAIAGATTSNGQSTTSEVPAIFDGTSSAKSFYINYLIDDADQDITTTPCNLIMNGTIEITWVLLGDY